MSNMPPPSMSPAPRSRGMRKGTHSCFECRRRKIRCVFRPQEPSVCVPCKGRGSECTEQKREFRQDAAENGKVNLKERVAKLEAVIAASGLSTQNLTVPPSATDLATNPHNSLAASESSTPKSTDSSTGRLTQISSSQHSGPIAADSVDTDTPRDIDPIVNLFNNSIWRHNSSDENIGIDSNRPSIDGISANDKDPKVWTKRFNTRQTLLSVLPAAELLAAILNVTRSWWDTWLPLGPWLFDTNTIKRPKTFQEFLLWAFSSDNPPIVGLAILCVAVSIQQLDPTTHELILRQLPRLPGEMFHEYFELVDRLIVNDSEYASTKEGIEVIILCAKMLMNLGLIKKSWVLNHRMISYAQLLGLHRPQRLSAQESDIERQSRYQAWLWICQSDVVLSLLLGLPYASDGRTIPSNMLGKSGTLSFFQHRLVVLAGRVIDKNQMGLSLSVHTTEAIQKDMDSLAIRMPEGFWDVQGSFIGGKITQAEYYDWISAQNLFHLIRVFLHMPLMIQSIDDPHLTPYRKACLEAARDSLKIYQIMRTQSGTAFTMVKLIDYHAFICSALLILGMMGYGNTQLPVKMDTSNKDKELVQSILITLRQASTTVNNTIATQALQGLEGLTKLASGENCPIRTGDCQTPYARIVVPYSGIITISPGPYMMERHSLSRLPMTISGPVFKLSQSLSEPAVEYGSFHASGIPENGSGKLDASSRQENESFVDLEYPSIDFDWNYMMHMNAEEDWAWLTDVNNNGVV